MSLYGCGIGKRLGDIVISSVLLCLLSPVMFNVAVLLLFNGFGQVLFRQKRPGKNGRLFALMKFKTMKG
jgi:lipopolysaccharide/colanic/teichoic acid biosynthesis glycosyltransferase